MINTALLHTDVQAFLQDHADTPLDKIIFKGSPFPEVSIQELAQQLEGKRKAKNKLPLWFNTPGILFPPKLNLEQTSSAATAKYKSTLMQGDTLLDGTGGFGIDTYYFAQRIAEVTHIEMNAVLSAFAKSNLDTLNVDNVTAVIGDSMMYLEQSETVYNTIFLDPGRRNEHKGKVFMLRDCLPSVPQHLDLLLSRCKVLWVKTAPILDLTAGLVELGNVSEIHIVAVKNEVKELLWKIEPVPSPLEITTVNLRNENTDLVPFSMQRSMNAVASFGPVQTYIYEPNAALMKSGAFDWISEYYALDKLHQHSHLYTSDTLIDFPGRCFKVVQKLPYSKKITRQLEIQKANITTRNFPMSVIDIRKKLKIKEGGQNYLFFTTLLDNSLVVLATEKT